MLIYTLESSFVYPSGLAQRKRAGPITQRSEDRNLYPLPLLHFFNSKITSSVGRMSSFYLQRCASIRIIKFKNYRATILRCLLKSYFARFNAHFITYCKHLNRKFNTRKMQYRLRLYAVVSLIQCHIENEFCKVSSAECQHLCN